MYNLFPWHTDFLCHIFRGYEFFGDNQIFMTNFFFTSCEVQIFCCLYIAAITLPLVIKLQNQIFLFLHYVCMVPTLRIFFLVVLHIARCSHLARIRLLLFYIARGMLIAGSLSCCFYIAYVLHLAESCFFCFKLHATFTLQIPYSALLLCTWQIPSSLYSYYCF